MLSSGSPPPSAPAELVYPRSTIATRKPAAPPEVSREKPARQWQAPIPWVTDWIDKNRKLLFAIAVLPFVLTFNGRWRIGLDSATYRGLGHALALGRGYHFGEFATKQAYPGLPLLLAGLEKRPEIAEALNASFDRMLARYREVQAELPELAPKPKKRDYRRRKRG